MAEVGLARSLEAALRERADPERRAVTRGYFASALEILGVSAAGIRSVIREHRDTWRGLEPEDVVALAAALVAGGTHEGRQTGYEILETRKDTRPLLDRATLESLGAGNDNWASVDAFATRVAGPAMSGGHCRCAGSWRTTRRTWW